ncbi:hypothetical protein Glove_132g201 [Diversispora epigaea]|uniref:Uncharacterized protein n=1 Tax=Diversispora epigaea TaxID=1348612 RepID=A0A397IXJ9_9GLOM|nr:hypothetical protein Glove_132g201 [Diversispora epigaea]
MQNNENNWASNKYLKGLIFTSFHLFFTIIRKKKIYLQLLQIIFFSKMPVMTRAQYRKQQQQNQQPYQRTQRQQLLQQQQQHQNQQQSPPQHKRGRGRPRKNLPQQQKPSPQQKRGRGRPRKNQTQPKLQPQLQIQPEQ